MAEAPDLNEREQQILQAVVNSYITTADPVGSRSVVKRFELGLSPATVRNVMADLEEMGYLQQIHTSSGRIPTDAGYRYYVNYLMHVQELTLRERNRIEHEFTEKLNDADEVLQHTSQLLALISNQAGLAEAPGNDHAYVNRLEIMSVGPQRVAMLVVDNYGRVRTQTLNLVETIHADRLAVLNRFLNEQLRGIRLDGLTEAIENRLKTFLDEQRKIAELALQVLGLAPQQATTQLFLEGASHLFAQPEFQGVDRAREVFDLFEERSLLTDMLRGTLSDQERINNSIHIGRIEGASGLEDISVVTSPYYCNDEPVGMIGVLGPRRMPYSRLTSLVDYTAGMVTRMLTRLAR
jgi:heat-inducible transcriptional repressor